MLRLLLVEDSPADANLVREALKACPQPIDLAVSPDGYDALRRLNRDAPYAHAPRPHLILLDLNLPKVNGHEVLRALKGHSGLRTIPVIIFTTSSAPIDIVDAYDSYANGFVVKPLDLDAFFDSVCQIVAFWFDTVHLPPSKS